MAKATKKCRVCGADYEYCHTFIKNKGTYRWQDVACCPEHGSIYLERVLISRGLLPETPTNTEKEDSAFIDSSDALSEDELYENEYDEDEDDEEDE